MTTANEHSARAGGISEDVRIRLAYPDDVPVLERLAALDSQQPLEGDALIAEIDGVAMAALSVPGGRVVADPFVHTASVVDLLRVRASLAAPRAGAGRLSRRLRREGPEVCPS